MEFRKIFSVIPRPFRKKGVWVTVSLFLRALLDFAGVVVFIPVLAEVLEKDGTFETVLPVALAALAFILLKGAAVLLLTGFRSRFVFSLYSDLSDRVLKNYLGRGLQFIRSAVSVDLANKVNVVTMTFTSGMIMSFLNVISSVILLAIILTALFIYEPLPTLALLAVIGPFMFCYSFFLRKKLKNLGVTENRARRDQARTVYELFRGYPEYYINDALDSQMNLFHSRLSQVGDVRVKAESYSALSSGFMEITVMLSIIILMLLSMTASWGISMTFGIFALSAMKILPSVRSLVASWQAMQSAEFSVDILAEILLPDAGSGTASVPCRGGNSAAAVPVAPERLAFSRSISLRSASFGYGEGSGRLFRNLNLEIRKGEYVGIKGKSGAGKTTLFNILMGFYPLQEGGLYVDDVLISPDRVRSWQALIGYVPQDVFLINGSFVENVAFGKSPDSADRQKIEHIFRKVGLWDWISSLPQGMDSKIAEAGNSVSGGQKQRIGIARALYKGASVLFFDEATSSVDPESESEINNFVTELSDEDNTLTVIVIAHRQETLSACRRIIDLDALTADRSQK